ncbi:hypothetical protein ZIOFF_059226 [Zingiber officinale]|uniref:Small ribosomal subunit protein eS1 n=1 Tax=Zingiber officinale TaxID=94328 RepID=A0A8J5F921_ZINOF|nr:hypothetical protein ZIOFF_059226 [Zingiber officinale]
MAVGLDSPTISVFRVFDLPYKLISLTLSLFRSCLQEEQTNLERQKGRKKEDVLIPDVCSDVPIAASIPSPRRTGTTSKHHPSSASGTSARHLCQGHREPRGFFMDKFYLKIASEGLKHRVFEVSLAELQNDEDQAYRKIRLRAEDVQGKNVLTNFWGMDFTTDKLRSLVKKWQTLIEAHVDVKTTDNYTLRLFCIAFTKRRPNQVKRTCYAQSSQIRQIRRKMTEIMVNQASSCDLKDLVQKFIPEVIGKEIEKATTSIFPLQNVFIRKVKILKAPKFDLGKLMEVHGDYKEDVGVKLDRPAEDVQMEGESDAVAA